MRNTMWDQGAVINSCIYNQSQSSMAFVIHKSIIIKINQYYLGLRNASNKQHNSLKHTNLL